MLSRSLHRAGSATCRGLAVLVLLVTVGGGEARADAKVNWSEYIEPAGSRPLTRTTGPERPAKSTATAKTRPSRVSKQQRAKQSRAHKRANKRSVRNRRRR